MKLWASEHKHARLARNQVRSPQLESNTKTPESHFTSPLHTTPHRIQHTTAYNTQQKKKNDSDTTM